MKNSNNSSKVVISFSGGKDSILSLYRMIKQKFKVIGLLVTFDKQDNSCFHGIPKHVMKKLSKALNIPLIEVDCTEGKIYEEEFEKALITAKEKGAGICIFGDIDIEHHRKWGMDRCKNAGLESQFPLWQENREKITTEFIDYGFKAVIKKVKLSILKEDFLGKVLTKELIKDIKDAGSDPCGENGEYHTIVFDGPIFQNNVEFKVIENKVIDDYGYLVID